MLKDGVMCKITYFQFMKDCSMHVFIAQNWKAYIGIRYCNDYEQDISVQYVHHVQGQEAIFVGTHDMYKPSERYYVLVQETGNAQMGTRTHTQTITDAM